MPIQLFHYWLCPIVCQYMHIHVACSLLVSLLKVQYYLYGVNVKCIVSHRMPSALIIHCFDTVKLELSLASHDLPSLPFESGHKQVLVSIEIMWVWMWWVKSVVLWPSTVASCMQCHIHVHVACKRVLDYMYLHVHVYMYIFI